MRSSKMAFQTLESRISCAAEGTMERETLALLLLLPQTGVHCQSPENERGWEAEAMEHVCFWRKWTGSEEKG